MFGYEFINQVAEEINNNPVFKTGVTGAKTMALCLLLLKILHTFISSIDDNDGIPKISNILPLLGFGLFIAGSDWIVNFIEQIFASVPYSLPASTVHELPNPAKEYLQQVMGLSEEGDVFDKMYLSISTIPMTIFAIVIMLLQSVIYLLDVAVTAVYFLQRIFLLQLFKFLFPFAIALSTTRGFEDLLPRWVKIYIGLFVLGIAYLAIYNFCGVVFEMLQNNINNVFSIPNPSDDAFLEMTNSETLFWATCGALIISFMVKVGLMSVVTKEVRGFFN